MQIQLRKIVFLLRNIKIMESVQTFIKKKQKCEKRKPKQVTQADIFSFY